VCTVTHAPAVEYQCAVTVALEHGQIALEALVANSAITSGRPFPMAVAGGTGSYRSARGDATVALQSETLGTLMIRLRP
jgi:hypothetical protein